MLLVLMAPPQAGGGRRRSLVAAVLVVPLVAASAMVGLIVLPAGERLAPLAVASTVALVQGVLGQQLVVERKSELVQGPGLGLRLLQVQVRVRAR